MYLIPLVSILLALGGLALPFSPAVRALAATLPALQRDGGAVAAYQATTAPTALEPTAPEIVPVVPAAPLADGSILHQVESGQTLWAIADAYGTTPEDLIALNDLDPENPVIYAGQKLAIRVAFTPTTSPTITETSRPATRTPRPTYTPRPTRATSTPAPTLTPTPPPLLPEISVFRSVNRQAIGIGMIVVCGLGLLVMIITGLRRGS
ncbi:MAG: LysM peptidoglycan-binding domain-containing protein [Chloroflexi bacterium]|nr:LysM peptidoglycan-binding domain-containing protein [Chloroflexota bacterium]